MMFGGFTCSFESSTGKNRHNTAIVPRRGLTHSKLRSSRDVECITILKSIESEMNDADYDNEGGWLCTGPALDPHLVSSFVAWLTDNFQESCAHAPRSNRIVAGYCRPVPPGHGFGLLRAGGRSLGGGRSGQQIDFGIGGGRGGGRGRASYPRVDLLAGGGNGYRRWSGTRFGEHRNFHAPHVSGPATRNCNVPLGGNRHLDLSMPHRRDLGLALGALGG